MTILPLGSRCPVPSTAPSRSTPLAHALIAPKFREILGAAAVTRFQRLIEHPANETRSVTWIRP